MQQSSTPQPTGEIQVWDLWVRLFHWSFVASFFTAYITGDEWLTPHVMAGYLALGLVLFRLFWGFVGGPYARFSNFVYRPKVVLGYVKDVLASRPARYLGHNPAGGAMIVALLVMMTLTTVSGLALYGSSELAGPLVWLTGDFGQHANKRLEIIHEICANLMIVMVAFHLLGVVAASRHHRENLALAMVTGRKRVEE